MQGREYLQIVYLSNRSTQSCVYVGEMTNERDADAPQEKHRGI